MIRSREWDLVVFDPLDAERFRRPIDGGEEIKWFKRVLLNESSNLEYDELFHSLNVKALTVEQATPEWFFTRMFSCTSSSTDRLFVELKKTITAGNGAILIDRATYCSISRVLNAVYGPGWHRRYVILYYIRDVF